MFQRGSQASYRIFGNISSVLLLPHLDTLPAQAPSVKPLPSKGSSRFQRSNVHRFPSPPLLVHRCRLSLADFSQTCSGTRTPLCHLRDSSAHRFSPPPLLFHHCRFPPAHPSQTSSATPTSRPPSTPASNKPCKP
eukprot:1152842-Pelagomonas_calceolata.AAC.3